ncbi:hypothetical protein DW830_04060 [Prevotella sp. AM34-19LB]|uniref:hypothetical protein n=1 Tax=Prevotella sp. AM34-19LB TaxID=2292364 RepID=UPI000E5D3C4D|nr:hypothetical protein [Prevotella sp. AM34-19LB]RHC78188.1 hypothetical protein DW830_04060 [Prevotella sp. AM34-19LB]
MAQKKSCTDAVNLYEDVIKCPGQKRLPGTRAYGWFIRRAYITKLAEPQKEAAAALKEYLVIKESHTLQADKKWIRVEFIPDKSSIAPESQGEEGSKTMNNKATLVLPGTEEEQQATAPCSSTTTVSSSSLSAMVRFASSVTMPSLSPSLHLQLQVLLSPMSLTLRWKSLLRARLCLHSTLVTSLPLMVHIAVRPAS